MKHCAKCGCEIVNGKNGCSLLDTCFTCNGGYPRYPAPVEVNPFESADLDALEDRCLDDAYALE